ncbi:MAG: exosortase system-associated protein, TIGR04073 family [Candidatus Rokubacteria bacterium]|nr:exosortase system-associated protein, TIGR04073 family [Candidatus Rokubacteria bacterium]
MKLGRWTFATLLSLALTGMSTSVWAAESTAERIALKAARGVDNTVLGMVTEWPKTIYYESKAHGVPYGATVGAVQGLGAGMVRTAVGLYELVTFPFPVPSGYRPILSPEFSLEPQQTQIAR